MTKASVTSVNTIIHPKGSLVLHKKATYKDGWSPTLICLKAHLQALTLILRHLNRRSSRSGWRSQRDVSIDIAAITSAWERQVLSFKTWKHPTDPYKLMDYTGYGPSYWRNITTYPSQTLLLSEITSVKNRLQGRQRTELRLLINHAVVLRNLAVERGKYANHLRSILGEHKPFIDLNTLQLNSTTLLTNSMEVHHQVTAHFQRWFSTPTTEQPISTAQPLIGAHYPPCPNLTLYQPSAT